MAIFICILKIHSRLEVGNGNVPKRFYIAF